MQPPGTFRNIDPDAEAARLIAERNARAEGGDSREQECVLRGGHCFEGDGMVLTSNPPQYPQTCKHCGKRRVATPREPFEYRDA